VERWLKTIQLRPAVEAGVNIPEKFAMKEAMKTEEGEAEFARHHGSWVMKGQDEERRKLG
jgi:glutathione S-transferase